MELALRTEISAFLLLNHVSDIMSSGNILLLTDLYSEGS